VHGSTTATITFTAADQERFAQLSGDRNPVHMDARAARRTQAGAPVVHGVNGVLTALERLCASGESFEGLASIKAQFPKFIYLDVPVDVRVARRSDTALKAELATEDAVVTILDLKFGPRKSGAPSADGPLDAIETAPKVLSFPDAENQRGRLAIINGSQFQEDYPALCAALGAQRVEALALLSTIVGMQCPGLHSIFSGFSIQLTEPEDDAIAVNWGTTRTDERFRLITMQARGGGIEGDVQAFMRVEPVDMPSITAIAEKVNPTEFAHRKALIIGGSRGLGAATAKAIAAGGGQVYVTYASGAADAKNVVSEISAMCGAGAAASLLCDVSGDIGPQLAELPNDITHIYYFATPRIGHQSAKVYARGRLDGLLGIYADGLAAVMQWAAANIVHKPLTVMYPSTVFIDERPKGMTEYAMAKAAGEILAKDLASAFGFRLSTPRIPRVLTDQTASILPIDTADAVDVMLPLLRGET